MKSHAIQDPFCSSHIYYSHCDNDVRSEFDDIAIMLCPDGFDRVPEMDELYTTAQDAVGSDMVFETPHIDGPFGFLPFTLYRCIFAIKGSDAIETVVFPRKNVHDGKKVTLKDNEFIMFDYNKDLHYITKKNDSSIERVVMKLHFVKKQPYYKVFAFANYMWNSFARILFNISKQPKTMSKRILSYVINSTTCVYSFTSSFY